MLLTTLTPPPPYRFDLLLRLLERYAHPTLDIVHRGAYWRALNVNGAVALLRVTARGAVTAPALDVYVMAHDGEPQLPALRDRLAALLPLDSAVAFYEFARQDARLWQVIEPVVGLPEVRSATVFEALAQTIIEQQISWTTAQRAQRWLVEWAGNRIVHNGLTFYTFPTAPQLAAASVDDLTPLKITFKRINLLIEIARQQAAGELDLERLKHLSPEAAYADLLRIKGIGHWTAVVTLARASGYRGVAHNDVALQAAVNRYFYGGKGRIPAALVAETFARYGPFAGLAADHTLARWVLEQYPPRLSSFT
ncbi:MAG: DNA-3-methyladenine glycosylase 2 family protein [Chloroflexi bacterium]|nr:DNA-3-methyladenine glycosylase 2 family protein [Chloroflexota bacterium]